VEAEKQVYSASTSRAETKIKTPGWRTVPGTT